jgi:hypothetical protein
VITQNLRRRLEPDGEAEKVGETGTATETERLVGGNAGQQHRDGLKGWTDTPGVSGVVRSAWTVKTGAANNAGYCRGRG